eukprot:scaffold15453_cov110-Isochrysis_galbana.AAC.6
MSGQGGGKRNLHLVFRGRWTIARGPSHTPFGGVRNLAITYRRCGANRAPPDSLYSHTANANDTPNGSRERDQLKTITGANAPWGHSGNLKEGTSPGGEGRRGPAHGRASPPPHLSRGNPHRPTPHA